MSEAIIGSPPALLPEDDENAEAVPETNLEWTGTVPPEWDGWRLDRALVALFPASSRSHLKVLIEEGCAELGGQVALSASRRLRANQTLRVQWHSPRHEVPFEGEDIPIDAIFEDEHLLVLNKRAGWVVHPAAGNWSGTLLNALLFRHPAAKQLPRAGIVHRLDKDTSGLMVVAKSLDAYHALVEQLAQRQVGREYMALCHGVVPGAFSVDAPIGRDPRNRVRMAVVSDGKPAKTDFHPLMLGEKVSLLHCVLHSGRTHQIRVHASQRGYSLVADLLYGGRPMGGLQRQGLHAARLKLQHPKTAQILQWNLAPPADFLAAADELVGWTGGGLPASA